MLSSLDGHRCQCGGSASAEIYLQLLGNSLQSQLSVVVLTCDEAERERKQGQY